MHRWLLCGLAVAVFAATTAVVGAGQGAPIRFLVLDTSLGLVFVTAGMVAWARRPDVSTGPLLTACGALWFVGSYGPTDIGWLAALGLSFERYFDLVLAYLVLTFPTGRMRGFTRGLLLMLATALAVRSLTRLLVYDPPTLNPASCPRCPANPFAVPADPDILWRTETVLGVVVVGGYLTVAGLVVRRWKQAPPPSRRVLAPVLAAGAGAAAAAAYQAANLVAQVDLGRSLLPLEPPWHEVEAWTLYGMRALIPIGFAVGVWRLRAAQGPAARLAIEFGSDGGPPERIGPALRRALDDPTLEVRRWDAGQDAWVDEDGAIVGAAANSDENRSILLLERAGTAVAAVLHDPVLVEDPGLLASIGAVLRLTMDNERLSAELHRQLVEVRESRARILAATDGERRRIERDLHDGAQHRLLSVSMQVQEARAAARDGAAATRVPAQLDLIAGELREAIRELRELARGIHPSVLTSEGLDPALRALARRSPIPVDLRADLDARLPGPVETAAYYVVAEGLVNAARHARASRISVRLSRDLSGLMVEVCDDGIGGASADRGSGLRGLADRVAALNGSLTVGDDPGGGTSLRAKLPCG